MTILPPAFLAKTARAMSHGAEKYGRWDYLGVPEMGRLYSASLLRHLTAWMGGEEIDPDSGLHHLALVSANLAILISADAHGVNIGEWREPSVKLVPKTPALDDPAEARRGIPVERRERHGLL